MIDTNKLYTAKELNEIMGYSKDKSPSNNNVAQITARCKNAGLIIEPVGRGPKNAMLYKILENTFLLEGEIWKPCYLSDEVEVSNLGRIRRISTKKFLGALDKSYNYIRVTLLDKKTGKQHCWQASRMIFFTFYPELLSQKDNIQVDHINGIRTDNRLENLRPLSNIENTQMRDNNQAESKTLTTELIMKYGYEKTQKILENLLTNDNLYDIILSESEGERKNE